MSSRRLASAEAEIAGYDLEIDGSLFPPPLWLLCVGPGPGECNRVIGEDGTSTGEEIWDRLSAFAFLKGGGKR